MGFMDKAKKMAEQAQTKLDEAQSKINSNQSGQQAGGGPVVEYDKHGRPIQSTAPVPDAGAPPVATPGVPQTEPASSAPPASAGPTPDPGAPAPATPAVPAPAPSPPAAAGPAPDPAAPDDRNRPSTEAPKMSSGDPLAG